MGLLTVVFQLDPIHSSLHVAPGQPNKSESGFTFVNAEMQNPPPPQVSLNLLCITLTLLLKWSAQTPDMTFSSHLAPLIYTNGLCLHRETEHCLPGRLR